MWIQKLSWESIANRGATKVSEDKLGTACDVRKDMDYFGQIVEEVMM